MATTRGSQHSVAVSLRLQRMAAALPHLVFQRLESRVFRVAFLTVLLVAGVQQFVGWKFLGVMVRETVASVQNQVLPWIGPDAEPRLLKASDRKVVALLIGDELFADREGFAHKVPLPPDRLAELLDQTLKAVKSNPRALHPILVIDFDLAPRVVDNVEVDQKARQPLDDWLTANASSLVLLEPSWTTWNATTLARQLEWARRLCGYADTSTVRPRGAVFARATLESTFGFVRDRQPRDGSSGPPWDIGRAVADHLGDKGQRRNPICDRLQGDLPANRAQDPPLLMSLQLKLQRELRDHGELQLRPQRAEGSGDVELRAEAIHADAGCMPRRLDEVPRLECLREAEVVVVGGAWRHGASDRHDTFVGETDGALVHTAWIRSWLKPVHHLNKLLDILLDVIIIESLLHPILEFAFAGMRSQTRLLSQRMEGIRAFRFMGWRVSKAIVLGMLALSALLATALALILIDGLLRWAFDSALSIDKSILALVIWSGVALAGLSRHGATPGRRHGTHGGHASPAAAALWLTVLCGACALLVGGGWKLAATWPEHVPAAVAAGLTITLLVFVLHRAWSAAAHPPERPLQARAERLEQRWGVLVRSIGRSLTGARGARVPAPSAVVRTGDFAGALAWMAIWVLAVWLFVDATLWALLLALLGG